MRYSQIITHPGGSHKDDFLACCLLISEHEAPVMRREPTAEDLGNPEIAVVDVGNLHEPEHGNFDHHQFPKDHPPVCALSLVLQHLGLYEDAQSFCDWLEPAEWLDTRGPMETSKWLGIGRDTLAKLNSPIDITLLRRFAKCTEIRSGEPLWEVMRWIGSDLTEYLNSLRERLDYVAQHSVVWELDTPTGPLNVLFMPRTEPMPNEPSAGLGRYIESLADERVIAGMVYPDRRGAGYGLSRFQDHPSFDFTRIDACDDVHFAHARGFVAKTTATDPKRLKELLVMAWGE